MLSHSLRAMFAKIYPWITKKMVLITDIGFRFSGYNRVSVRFLAAATVKYCPCFIIMCNYDMMYRLMFWHFIVHIKLRLILLMENWIKSLWFMKKGALRVNYHEVSSVCNKLIVTISFTKSKADMIKYSNLGNAQNIAMLFLWLICSETVRMSVIHSWGLEQWDVMTLYTLVVKSEYGKISRIDGKLHGIVQEFALGIFYLMI